MKITDTRRSYETYTGKSTGTKPGHGHIGASDHPFQECDGCHGGDGKVKDKKFAAGCSRDVILKGCEMLGMDVKDVAAICIEGMKPYAEELHSWGTRRSICAQVSL